MVHCICGTDLLSSKEASAGEVALASILDGGSSGMCRKIWQLDSGYWQTNLWRGCSVRCTSWGTSFTPIWADEPSGCAAFVQRLYYGEIFLFSPIGREASSKRSKWRSFELLKPDATSDAIRIRRMMRRCFAEFLPDCSPFVRSAFEVAFRENSARTSRKSPSPSNSRVLGLLRHVLKGPY